MLTAIIITFFLGCVWIGFLSTKNDKFRKTSIVCITLCMMVLYMLGIISAMNNKQAIQAIEVYRGNTTLQITYQDSIPIDSVVVYKNK